MANLRNSVGQVVLPVDGVRIPVDPLKRKPPGNGPKILKGRIEKTHSKDLRPRGWSWRHVRGLVDPLVQLYTFNKVVLHIWRYYNGRLSLKLDKSKKFKHVYAMWYISHRHGVDMVDGSAPGHGDHEVDARVHRDEVRHHVRSEIFPM